MVLRAAVASGEGVWLLESALKKGLAQKEWCGSWPEGLRLSWRWQALEVWAVGDTAHEVHVPVSESIDRGDSGDRCSPRLLQLPEEFLRPLLLGC